jgi:hypothetical protein
MSKYLSETRRTWTRDKGSGESLKGEDITINTKALENETRPCANDGSSSGGPDHSLKQQGKEDMQRRG